VTCLAFALVDHCEYGSNNHLDDLHHKQYVAQELGDGCYDVHNHWA